jgi:hypothetical protein
MPLTKYLDAEASVVICSQSTEQAIQVAVPGTLNSTLKSSISSPPPLSLVAHTHCALKSLVPEWTSQFRMLHKGLAGGFQHLHLIVIWQLMS